MQIEAILSFFLLLHLRKTLRIFSPHAGWDRLLKAGMITVGVLFVLDNVLPIALFTKWIWHLGLLWIISLAFREPLFFATRITMYAILPLASLSILSSIISAVLPSLRSRIDEYNNYAYPVAITWMVAMLIRSRRQMKALREEHRKRQEEEEEHRRMMVRKAELELLVAERTAELVQQKEELRLALEDLRSTQNQLIQKEKMASLGELTAGIAHEIKNPLNFINNFSELSVELAEEIQAQINRLPVDDPEKEELLYLLQDLILNQKKIHHHGSKADGIVKSMLLHSQKSAGQKELINVNELADEYLRLTYHGLRAKDNSFTATLHTSFDEKVENISAVPQDIGRVLINLFNNAFYAVNEKKRKLNGAFEPTVFVGTRKSDNKVEIIIRDNGPGIPPKVLDKIYQPFFTTKPAGEGTGLGLSLSYDIITKGHGGEIHVETEEGNGAGFIIALPVNQ